MVDFIKKNCYTIEDLRAIMALLRSEQGCPWDREQTHQSIRRNFIEEAYEAVEAIDEEDAEHLKEELGDVLLQVVFHARMEEEKGVFNLDDVADRVCKKLVLRHPHIFGDVKADNSEQVLNNWEEIKKLEKGQETTTDSMESVCRAMPGLWRAEKVQKKARKVGFDWNDANGALDKLEEEVAELRCAAPGVQAEEELGDVLFAAVNAARFMDVDPEQAINRACDKFISRFSKVEKLAAESGRDLKNMSLEEMDALWDKAKADERVNKE
ncbi:MAG: nucleoside triphosphate pyrophosphohydrolase [Oscillospiraceae bacterium]|nr:nucleoside triphosphate pyrophosphohydrolase [Oscillospiraceae bacterium]